MSAISTLHAHTPVLTVIEPRGFAVRSVSLYRTRCGQLPCARVERSAYDATGRCIERWDPRLWAAANNALDPSGNRVAIHSLTGKPLLSDSVDAGWRAQLWGVADQRERHWDAKGQLQRFEYDDLLRPVAVFEGDGVVERCVERLAYGQVGDSLANQCGQLIRHDDPAGSLINVEFGLTGAVLEQTRCFLSAFDTPDWPESIDVRHPWLEPGAGARTRWQVGSMGEVVEQIDAVGNVQRFAQTLAGQLRHSGVQLQGQALKELIRDIRYDAQGRIESETAGNGMVAQLSYDPADGRLLNLRADKGRLQNLNYRYDPAGNVVSIEDTAQPTRYFANQRIEPLRTFAYDTLYQLIEATGYEAASLNQRPGATGRTSFATANELGRYTQRYEYDASGNLQKLVHSGTQNHTRRIATACASNRSLSHAGEQPPSEEQIAAGFDLNGNLLELAPGQALSWDARNQLSEVTPVKRESGLNDREIYRYDGAGMRVRKVHMTQAGAVRHQHEVRYLPGLEVRRNTATGELLHVIEVNAGQGRIRMLHWQSGRPAEIENDQMRYSLTDHLGSSTLELDGDAALISQETYYPYGETAWFAARSEVQAAYKTVRYSGKERDVTGLYYYGLRYYAPWLMRWLNPDPAGDIDGLNYYRFVRNNPLGFEDPSGSKPSKPFKAATVAYDLMFDKGEEWKGLKYGDETGLDTIRRISRQNVKALSDDLDTERQRVVAKRIAQIFPVDSWITHFSDQDFTTWRGVKFRSTVGMRKWLKNKEYTGNSELDIKYFATHDFAFFGWEAGGAQPNKESSFLGRYRYHAPMTALGDKFEYSHVELSDFDKPNERQVSEERAKSLQWLKGRDATPAGIRSFQEREGLGEIKAKDSIFLGSDMLSGMGMRVAADLDSLTPETQDAIVEWSAGNRATENMSQIVNAFYRPQIVVPGGLKIKTGQFTLRRL